MSNSGKGLACGCHRYQGHRDIFFSCVLANGGALVMKKLPRQSSLKVKGKNGIRRRTIRSAFSSSLQLIETLEARRLLSAGDLDLSFGSNGSVVTGAMLGNLPIQANGDIIVQNLNSFALARYLPGGSKDNA